MKALFQPQINAAKSQKKGKFLGVAQLVARYLGVVEAASSSLVTQTKQDQSEHGLVLFFALKWAF